MNLTVLAASGQTGIALTRQALRRGHTVTAVARDPERIAVPDCSPTGRKAPVGARSAWRPRPPSAWARSAAGKPSPRRGSTKPRRLVFPVPWPCR
ncbi:MAG TPA: NAD(P)H-binding protein [Streptomyces sp.]|nr:NAD(P)H-binding protein [Streptomyces sp.]